MKFHGLGSMPGTDVAEAADIIAGESHNGALVLPVLPGRGLGADHIGRTGALLADLALDRGPRSWRVVEGSAERLSRASWHARDYLQRDLDTCEEVWGNAVDELRVTAVGPWTLAASIELSHGHAFLTDKGAVRFLADSLAHGLANHLAEVRRRHACATVNVLLREPLLADVTHGRILDATGGHRLSAVGHVEMSEVWRRVTEVIVDEKTSVTIMPGGAAGELSIHALSASGAQGIVMSIDRIRGTQALDNIGVLISDDMNLEMGVVPGRPPIGVSEAPEERSLAQAVAKVWDELSFPRTDMLTRLDITTRGDMNNAPTSWPAQALAAGRNTAELIARAAGDL
ncbi:methionine synthase [Corynebacterium sp. H78]|uniref:methionine synthase n=1 Tax=Corynebacterium sp. H78 TaxID=3133417 RepID=UPI0030A532B4